MELVNRTPYPAKLFRTSIDDHRLAAALVMRVTYEWRDGAFRPADEQPWIVSDGPWETGYGEMPGDELFYRGGVDLFLLGEARPPNAQQVTSLDVSVELGAFRSAVRVFGDRVWQRTAAGLRPSPPAPIITVPLTLFNAYGGRVDWDGLDTPYQPNPAGKGFYIEEAAAEGMPLPNIEDPAALVEHWDDHPLPVGVGVCPNSFPGRMLAMINPETKEWEFSARLFNAAFPTMIAPAAQPGQVMVIRGVSPGPEMRLPIPTSHFEVRLRFDDEHIARRLPIDQVGVELAKRRIFVSYRYPFRYVMHRMQRRGCELVEGTPP